MSIYKYKLLQLTFWPALFLLLASTAFAQQLTPDEKNLIQDYEQGVLQIMSEAEKEIISVYQAQKYGDQLNRNVQIPGLHQVTNEFFFENFEDSTTYDNWVIEDLEGGFPWSFGDDRGAEGSLEGIYAIADSDAAGSATGRVWTTLTSPAISLEGFEGEELFLSFDHHFRALGEQVGRVQISVDGDSWQTVAEYTETQGQAPNVGVSELHLISQYSEAEEIYVRFEFDDAGDWTWYWLVDNISVYESSLDPAISLTPAEVDFGTLFAGTTGSVEVTFENPGFARLNVDDIATPAGVEADVSSFSIIPGNSRTVTFSYDAAVVSELDDFIILLTNIPGNEDITVPVRAEVIELLTELNEDFNDLEPGSVPPLWDVAGLTVAEDVGVDSTNGFRVNQWLFFPDASFETPFVNLEGNVSPIIYFDYRVTNWVPEGPPVTPTPVENFEINLFVVLEDGSEDHIGTIGDGTHDPSLDYTPVFFDISDYIGESVAFRLDSDYLAGDFNLDIDNVLVGEPPEDVDPVASVSTNSFSFGTVLLGESSSAEIMLNNDGLAPVTVNSVDLNGPFSVDFNGSEVIAPGQSLTLNTTFTPTAVDTFNTDMIISTDALESGTNGDFVVALEGVGVEAPEFTVNTNLISHSITLDELGEMIPGDINVAFTIENSGEGLLHYSIPAFASMMALNEAGDLRNNTSPITFSSLPDKGVADTREGHPVLLGAGGPDEFGYYWVDSNEGYGPLFNWVDAAENGTLLEGISNSDDGNTTVELPFDFSYYGETYSEVTVSVNGWLTFSDFDGWGYMNRQIPGTETPNALIAAMWDDLTAEHDGSVYTYSDESRFVIEWNSMAATADSETNYTFQAILHDDGTIQFQYHTLDGPVNTNTVGIENETGETGLQVAFNTDYLENQLAIAISASPQFITNVIPASGSVEANSEREVFVELDVTDFDAGTYSEEIVVLTNDPQNSREIVTVEVEVTGTPELVILEDLSFILEEINFGDVFVGNFVSFEAQVANAGSDMLILESFEIEGGSFDYTIAGFDPGEVELPLSLEAGTFIPVQIIFTPENQSAYTGTFSVEANGQEEQVSLSGTGTQPPIASLETDGFEFELPAGQTVDTTFTLENLAKATLEFDISFGSDDDEEQDAVSGLIERVSASLASRSPSELSGINLETARQISARAEESAQKNTPVRHQNDFDIIWNNPVDELGGIISTVFTPIDTPVYSAGYFEVFADAELGLIFAPGFNSGGGALGPLGNPALNFYIYENDGGVPAGNPVDGADNHVWSYTTTVDGDGVTITDGSDITLNILEATESMIDLEQGSYWLVVAPDANTANLGGTERWNWSQGSMLGVTSQIIDPADAFGEGFTDWTGLDVVIGDWTHVAFRLEGELDFPLSVSPLSGTIEGGPENAQVFDVNFSPEEPGSYEFVINVATNDPANPVLQVPVTANVLPAVDGPARLQIVHNAADPAGEFVDVFVNGEQLLDSLQFRTATPYFDVPSDADLDIEVAVAGNGVESSFYSTTAEFAPGESYTVIASGLVGGGFLSNPEGLDTDFTLHVLPDAREHAESIEDIDLRVFHGVTDAPAVELDLHLPGDSTFTISDLSYGDYTSYLSLSPDYYDLDIKAQETSANLYAYTLDLTEQESFAATVIASGFVNANANNRGPGFELLVVFENGSVMVPQGLATSVEIADELPDHFSLEQNYPNPFNPTTQITYNLPEAEMVQLEVYDMIGRRVALLVNSEMSAGTHQVTFDASSLSSGVYLYRLQAGSFVQTQKMMLIK